MEKGIATVTVKKCPPPFCVYSYVKFFVLYSYVKFFGVAIFDCCGCVICCICTHESAYCTRNIHTGMLQAHHTQGLCVNSIAVIASYGGELLVPICGCEYALGVVLCPHNKHIHGV